MIIAKNFKTTEREGIALDARIIVPTSACRKVSKGLRKRIVMRSTLPVDSENSIGDTKRD